jgi:hypothetical protein
MGQAISGVTLNELRSNIHHIPLGTEEQRGAIEDILNACALKGKRYATATIAQLKCDKSVIDTLEQKGWVTWCNDTHTRLELTSAFYTHCSETLLECGILNKIQPSKTVSEIFSAGIGGPNTHATINDFLPKSVLRNFQRLRITDPAEKAAMRAIVKVCAADNSWNTVVPVRAAGYGPNAPELAKLEAKGWIAWADDAHTTLKTSDAFFHHCYDALAKTMGAPER